MAEQNDSPGLLVNATYCVDIDDAETFKALASRMATAATKRDGCVFLKVAQDVNDATIFHLFEAWRDQAALDAHLASDDFQGVLQEAAKLKITGRVVDTYVVSSSVPLAIPS